MDFRNESMSILVIDDSDIIRTTLRKFLSEYDLEVITCNDGLEGLQKAIEHNPKLIMLDLLMPNLDGIRLLRVLKVMEQLKHIPVIIISGHTDKSNVIAAMEAGAEKIISKPLSKEVLIKTINEVLGHNFLSDAKRLLHLSPAEKDQMNKELKRYYVNSLVYKKETLRQSIENRNKDLLKMIVHELKGSSGTVGFNQITDLCRDLESVIAVPQSTWESIISKSDELLNSLIEIEVSYSK
ncbi:MAG: response regulator [Melioribacteraceae bacterium]|nr:response regulator [Melioribacteraceae bacterium]